MTRGWPNALDRLAGKAGQFTEYIIEGQGDAWGIESHPSLDHALARLADIAEYDGPWPNESVIRDRYDRAAFQFDPEDDRILVWEVLPTGHKRVVWHFSGWHWSSSDFRNQDGSVMAQGKLPGHDRDLYAEVMDDL